jgi:hypothetical protein
MSGGFRFVQEQVGWQPEEAGQTPDVLGGQ